MPRAFGGLIAAEAQQPPRAAADPPQPQHITHHHHGSRGCHPLRRSGSLCGTQPSKFMGCGAKEVVVAFMA